MKQARQALATLADEVTNVQLGEQALILLKEDLEALYEPPPPRAEWPVHMLYRFDPLLLAHKDKGWLVDPVYYKRVWRPAGHIEGTIVEHGCLIGTWRYKRTSRHLSITIDPFQPLPQHVKSIVEEKAEAIADFFGLQLAELIEKPKE